MTSKDFSKLQSILDNQGTLSAIVLVGKCKSRRYDVYINGEHIRRYKQKVSAKNKIASYFMLKIKKNNRNGRK